MTLRPLTQETGGTIWLGSKKGTGEVLIHTCCVTRLKDFSPDVHVICSFTSFSLCSNVALSEKPSLTTL